MLWTRKTGNRNIAEVKETGLRRLTEEDYRLDAVTVAKALLGAALCRRLDDGTVLRARIVETEAYCGEEDTACHAYKGRTPRTDVMYSPGGCAYIYLCYGMHEMLNVVTGPAERPEAVLIRGVEGAEGPGRLTKALHISRALNRENLVASDRLWIETDGSKPKFCSGPRIGIGYASKRDQSRKWRFTALENY
ncbi:MAG: DNA-3-methyladenine glycosylase [Kiritimatiellae bacterium]|nr:DNA-3-methyladenine glycosylase [Kiritimatiellia bacterium]